MTLYHTAWRSWPCTWDHKYIWGCNAVYHNRLYLNESANIIESFRAEFHISEPSHLALMVPVFDLMNTVSHVCLRDTRDYLTAGFGRLIHWGHVTHIRVSKLTIIGSDNGLSPGRRQAIICTNAGILLIGPWGTNFSEILAEIITFSFKQMYLKVSSAKWRPFCLCLNVLIKPALIANRCSPLPWSTLPWYDINPIMSSHHQSDGAI